MHTPTVDFRLRIEDGVDWREGDRETVPSFSPFPLQPIAVSSFRGTLQFKASWCRRLSVQGGPVGIGKSEFASSPNPSKSQGSAVEERLPPLCCRSTLPLPLFLEAFHLELYILELGKVESLTGGREEECAMNERERESLGMGGRKEGKREATE